MSAEITRLIEESSRLERSGEIALAIDRAHQARQLAQAAGDAEAESSVLSALAYAHIRFGRYDLAQQFCHQALALVGEDSRSRAEALLNLGICAGETDNMDLSEQLIQQAIDLSRRIGHDRILVRGLHALSCGVYMPRGQFAISLALDDEALRLAQTRGMPELSWGPLLTMSWVYWLTGQRPQTEARLAELAAVVSPGSLGDGYWHYIQAGLALQAGETDTAKAFFTKTLSIAESNGITENLFLARLGMSGLRRALGDNPAALAWADSALTIVERSGYHHLQGQALIERARARWALGDLPSAEADLRAAIERLTPQHLDFDRAIALLLLAALLHQQTHPEAMQAWGQAAACLIQGGFTFLVDRERALAFSLVVAGLACQIKSVVKASTTLLEQLQSAPPPVIKIATLGGWRIQVGPRPITRQALRQRSCGELLGLLLTSPGRSLAFEQVGEALWPQKEPIAMQTLLRHATSSLRRALEPDLPDKFPSRYLEVKEGRVTLHLPPFSTVDFEVFSAHCRRGEWAAALAVWGGEFLPEYAYDDWAATPRQWLAQEYQRALLGAAEAWLVEARYSQALEACWQVLAIEPWQERAVLLGMQACLALGDRSGALRLYKTLEKSLKEDLGVEPQADLQALYQSLRKG